MINAIKDGFRQRILFNPGYYKPEPNRSIHGMHVFWILTRDEAKPRVAMFFNLYTGWYPSTVKAEWQGGYTRAGSASAWYLGCHYTGPHAIEEYRDLSEKGCDWLNNQQCRVMEFGDRDDFFHGLVDYGDDWLWDAMQKRLIETEEKIAQVEADVNRFS